MLDADHHIQSTTRPGRRRAWKKAETSPEIELRKAMFKTVQIRQDGVKRHAYALEAYFLQLQKQAAAGDTNAFRETRALQTYMERSDLAKAEAARIFEESAFYVQLDKEHADRVKMISLMRGIFFALNVGNFRRKYEAALGPLPDFDEVTIELITPFTLPSKMGNRRHPSSAQTSEPVGYCRPPIQHRFQKGKSGNPSGCRKKPKADVFQVFRDGLMQKLTLRAGDELVTLSTIGAACSQLIARAMKGTAGARRLLRELIVFSISRGY